MPSGRRTKHLAHGKKVIAIVYYFCDKFAINISARYHKVMKKILLTLIVAILAIAGIWYLAVRNNTPQTSGDKLNVTATYYPLAEFARTIGGDAVSVKNLVPTGTEPHDYEPSPKTIADLSNTPIFIYNGATFEPWTDDFLKDYKGTIVKASTNVDTIKDGSVIDPHFWLDPVDAQIIVENIRQALVKQSPQNEAIFTANAKKLTDDLKQLDKEYTDGLAQCKSRIVIASHDAFTYLARRYDFTVEPIAGISPEVEPTPRRLAELSQLVRSKNIHYIFMESLASPRLAATIATETGAKTLVFNPIEGLTEEDEKTGKNYLSIQRDNLANLKTALACK